MCVLRYPPHETYWTSSVLAKRDTSSGLRTQCTARCVRSPRDGHTNNHDVGLLLVQKHRSHTAQHRAYREHRANTEHIEPGLVPSPFSASVSYNRNSHIDSTLHIYFIFYFLQLCVHGLRRFNFFFPYSFARSVDPCCTCIVANGLTTSMQPFQFTAERTRAPLVSSTASLPKQNPSSSIILLASGSGGGDGLSLSLSTYTYRTNRHILMAWHNGTMRMRHYS